MTRHQMAILTLGAILTLTFRAIYLAWTRDIHRQDVPQTRPIDIGAGLPDTVPLLVVDGPPSAHGQLPANGLPIDRRWSCSLCYDGTRPALPTSSICIWCGQEAVS